MGFFQKASKLLPKNPFKRTKSARSALWPKRSSPQLRKTRGLFDALLLILLLYGVYANTPLGAFTERSVRAVMGRKHLPSLFETFRAHETQVNLTSPQLPVKQASLLNITSLPFISLLNDLPIELLVAVIQSHGECKGSTCQIESPPFWQEYLEPERQRELSILKESAKIPIDIYAEALAKTVKKLNGHLEPAVEALYVGVAAVTRAINRAKQYTRRHAREILVHATHFSPGLRRGPLQDAFAIISQYRMATLSWPLDQKYKINSPYGIRLHPVLHKYLFHDGVDIAAPEGTPVRAAQRGRVNRVSNDSIGGKYIVLDHGFGIRTHYYHLSKIHVRKGQIVRQNQLIGRVGATGRTTGPHLHYTLWIGGRTVNPAEHGYVMR